MDPQDTSTPIAVIGAGSWGTALAQLLASQGFPVHLWALEPEVAKAIATHRENSFFLKGIPLSENIFPTSDIALAHFTAHGEVAGLGRGAGEQQISHACKAGEGAGVGSKGLAQAPYFGESPCYHGCPGVGPKV
jgi:glycerol-3-phosphate dehydrogenase